MKTLYHGQGMNASGNRNRRNTGMNEQAVREASLPIYAAPLQGITTRRFRQLHRELFGGVDRYYAPFFSPAAEHIMTDKERRELEGDAPACTVPQIMTRRSADFLWAAEVLYGFGYEEVNLNLGCPAGTVTAKGKGAGFLLHPDELEQFLSDVFAALSGRAVSVKTRLGYHGPEEFPRLVEIYNRCPIRELTVHPRVRQDFYKGPLRLEAFAAALPSLSMPVCYNGDLVTVEDVQAVTARFPGLSAVMIGRGLIADPALARKLRGGPPASREELRRLTEELYQSYREAIGPGPAAQRMKELWYYLIHLFDGGERLGKKLKRMSKPWEYPPLAAEVFETLPLRETPTAFS